MGWLLVVGGSHAEIPLIRVAQRLGYGVITTGNRPSDLGHSVADKYVPADFSKRDEILAVAEDAGVVGIVSGCNDFAALSTAYAAEKLGLPGHDSYENAVRLHHKDLFRAVLSELALPTPQAGVVFDEDQARILCQRLGYPVIVKPIDLTGGKGISVCAGPEELSGVVTAAVAVSRQDHVIVEQFMDGTRHGFTCFIENSNVGFWFADDEQYYLNPYLVSGTTTPSSLPPWALTELAAAVELMAASLGLVDGLMHIQCIMTNSGPRIIELCRRCPGDLYPMFVELSTRYDYALAVVSAELGVGIPATGATDTTECVARQCIMGSRSGVLRSINIDRDVAARVVHEQLWWTPGQVVDDYLTEKFGILFLRFAGVDEMRRLALEFNDRITIDFE